MEKVAVIQYDRHGHPDGPIMLMGKHQARLYCFLQNMSGFSSEDEDDNNDDEIYSKCKELYLSGKLEEAFDLFEEEISDDCIHRPAHWYSISEQEESNDDSFLR